MTEPVDKIEDGVVVTLTYTLTADGEEIERADKDDPLVYLHGAENIVPGLEKALAGKKAGEKVSVTLKPEDAYGEYDPDDTEEVDIDDFDEIDELTPGMELVLEDEDGDLFEVSVKEVLDDVVVLDFNPPLAGKTVVYDVEILSLRKGDDEEVAHGHPHHQDYEDED